MAEHVLRKRYGHARASREDQIDGEIADRRLREIEADPSRLVPFDEFLSKIGILNKVVGRRG